MNTEPRRLRTVSETERSAAMDVYFAELAAARAEQISREDYAAAIVRLLEAAHHDSSGGRAAAQVLLSAYNGGEFHLDVTDLCCLDHANLKAALDVMRGRAQLLKEPHSLINDGDAVFERLWHRWEHLRIPRRYRRRNRR